MNFQKKLIITPLIIAAFITIAAGAFAVNKLHPLETALEKRLPQIIGPAKKYSVKIKDTGILDVLSGDIKDLYLIAEEVTPKECPLLESVKVHLYNIAFDLDKIDKIEKANFIVVVNENSINDYLPRKVKDYPNLKVELKDKFITVNTVKKIMMFEVPVKVGGTLEVEGQKKVNFKCGNLNVAGVPLPDFAKRQLEEKVNPLVDLTEMRIITNILDVKITEKQLQIEGAASVAAPIYYGK